MQQQKQSDKLNIIDRATFELIHSNAEDEHNKRIQNSKYKRKNCTFNLLHFLAQPQADKSVRRHMKGRRVHTSAHVQKPMRKRGKTRENGRKKHTSRLKKNILKSRQNRQVVMGAEQDEMLQIAMEQFEKLTLKNTKPPALAHSLRHSGRFREYCDNCTTTPLGSHTETLLRELCRFQRRAFAHNPIRARGYRRMVIGFREVQSMLKMNKIKLVIMAPDCERSEEEGGLDEVIENIKKQCQQNRTPYVFSLRRRHIAHALFKKVPISCVGILSYEGARDIFYDLLDALKEAKQLYADNFQRPKDI